MTNFDGFLVFCCSDLIVGCEIDGVSETASCDAHTTKNGMHPDLLYTQSQHCWTAATGHQASGERDWSTFEHAFAKGWCAMINLIDVSRDVFVTLFFRNCPAIIFNTFVC